MSSAFPLSASLSPSYPAQAEDTPGEPDRIRKTVHKRSKTGCLVCRSRRIKCDLGQPECARCVKYGAECGYPSKKPLDIRAIDEKLSKRHRTSLNAPSSITPTSVASPLNPTLRPSLISTTEAGPSTPAPAVLRPRLYDDGPTSLDALHALCRMTTMGSFFSAPTAPPDFLREQFSDPDELRCFHHCLTYTFSILVVKEEKNPWVEHVMPMLFKPDAATPMSTEALRLSMLAIGATHLAYLHNRVEMERDSHVKALSAQYRAETIRILRQARKHEQELESNTYLAASLLLNHNDCLAGERAWREAWRYTKDAMQARGGCEAILYGRDGASRRMSVVEQTLLEQMAYVDIAACLSLGEPPAMLNPRRWWWERLARDVASQDGEDSFESTKGIQRSIVHLASRTAKLLADQRSMANHSLIYASRRGSVPHTVTDHVAMSPFGISFQTVVLAHNDDVITLSRDVDRWSETAQEDKLEARTRIGSRTFWHMIQIMLKHELQNRPRDDPVVQGHAKAIMDACIEAGDKIEFLNWPLLIASCVLSEPQLRDQSRSIIKMFAYQCCHEVVAIRDIVEEVWRRIDEGRDDRSCHYLEVMVDTGRAVLLG